MGYSLQDLQSKDFNTYKFFMCEIFLNLKEMYNKFIKNDAKEANDVEDHYEIEHLISLKS